MFKKSILTLAAGAALGVAALAPSTASATWDGGYGWYGRHDYAPYRFVYLPRYHAPWFGYRTYHPGWKYGAWKYRYHW